MRAIIMASTVAIALGAAASAQSALAPGNDGSEPVYLEADTLVEDRENGIYTATGGIRMRSGTRLLIADELEYRPGLNRIIARGNVQIFDGDAPAQLAEEIELDGRMSEGIARGFATLLENNGRAASAFALRRPDGSVELTDGYYTACELCEDGSSTPTWRLRARRVVRDQSDQMVYYRDVRLEVLGQPVLYSPVFAHPDPSTPRRSGLLIPSIDVSNRLGVIYQQPYLWVISPTQDLVIAPRLMSGAAPLLELDYRKRFYSGGINLETSVTYEREYDEDGFFGEDDWRWHIFADGRFRLTEAWRWGFGVQQASEDLYLRRYDFSETPDIGLGLYKVENRFLASQLFLQGRGENFYADAAVLRINSLVESANDDQIPTIAPLVRLAANLPFPEWAGQLETTASLANARREDGDDYTRASIGLEWSRVDILPMGIRLEPYALGRVDAYAVTQTNRQGVETGSQNFTRGMGAAGAEISWPFVRPSGWGNTIIGPRAHLASATGLDADQLAPNEDSTSIDLDSNLLFARNRAGGYDIWEDGTRLDLGLSTSVESFATFVPDIDVFVGRSVRLDGDPVFGVASGLATDESDWVAEFKVDLGYFDIAARNRLDTDDLDINRSDVLFSTDVWRVTSSVEYTRLLTSTGRLDENIRASASYRINDFWSAQYSVLHDLTDDISRIQSASLIYGDECTDFRIVYERREFDIGDLGTSESVKFQVTLFTLGSLEDN